MKTIFSSETIEELVSRINALEMNSQAQWGKMDAYHMLKHCTLSEEMFQGEKVYKRLLIGHLFGKMALKGILKDDALMKKNQPTHPEMKITGTGNFETEKIKWIQLVESYKSYSNSDFIHPFFGKMTREDIGTYVYKHSDHHLGQFGN
jgi:hypothetical protein